MTGPHDVETLDLPPPYTPTDTGESNHSINLSGSSAQHQQLPPDYHTIHEQLGYLANSSSSTNPTTTTKDRPSNVERQSSSSSTSGGSSINNAFFSNISYNASRGAIGNILNMAGNLVGNAANAANNALGTPPPRNPEAEYGAQIARNASIMANNASRYALEMIGGLVDGRNERRGQRDERREIRREHKQERRDVRREQKEERREMKRHGKERESYDSNASGSGTAPSSSKKIPEPPHGFPFVPPGRVPYQPYVPQQQYASGSSSGGERTSDYDANINTDSILEIKQTNAPIEIKETWSGHSCRLKTTNGHLNVHGSLTATDSIHLETSNGNVVVDGAMLVTKDINVKTSNGVFMLKGQSIIGKHVDVSISNSPLQINSIIQGKTISLKTKNAPVSLGQVSVGTELTVKTSNSPIELHILEITSNSADIVVESSNAPVHVYVPNTFAGEFSVSGGSASVVAKAVADSGLLKFQTDTSNKKVGTVKNLGTKANHEIHIKTSNADAILYI